ncbi:anoctamin [Chloropicon primus]|uniref:Anoctamin n=1 Tax=Chloropicon primus TaxID=1764295 RepID=A0A5B8MET2_9CHLO|nr:anoctamin [Chloropicon primus]|eukprot:QDZ17832.1 anoctamin [Chloropicon primus]
MSFKNAAGKAAAERAIKSSIKDTFRAVKKPPKQLYEELLKQNDTKFSPEELERLFTAFSILSKDRLQRSQFTDMVTQEIGWSSALLRDQLFKAFDRHGDGELDFVDFCRGYSTFLRGSVLDLVEFAWNLYRIGESDTLSVEDITKVLEHAVGCLEEVRLKHGSHIGTVVDTRFPEKTASALVEKCIEKNTGYLSKLEFKRLILRERAFIDSLIPAFQFVQVDPLHHAAEIGDADECSHLIKVDAFDPDGKDASLFPVTPLHLAAQYGHIKVCEVLMELGANPRLHDGDGNCPLHLAVIHDRPDVVDLYIDRKLELQVPTSENQTAFHLCAMYPHSRAMATLISKLKINLDTFRDDLGNSPVHSAAVSNNWKMLQLALDNNKLGTSGINAQNELGETPFLMACLHGSSQTAMMLLKLGADPTLANNLGKNALHVAVERKGNEEVLALLLKDGRCQINTADSTGCTALNLCVKTTDLKMFKILIDAGASINTTEIGTGYTPLHNAVLADWLHGVEVLLSQPDCKLLKDVKGRSPLDYARHSRIAEVLRDYIVRLHPKYSPDYPVEFLYALIFYDGNWVLQNDGDLRNKRVFSGTTVSKRISDGRAKHGLVDKKSLKAKLLSVGLILLEELVYKQEYVGGLVKGNVKQFTVVRVGAPLYRLQQQAMKIRHPCKRTDVNMVEDFFVDDLSYPKTGFHDFTQAEKVKLILSIIQGVPNSQEYSHVKGATIDHDVPDNCGVSLPLYRDFKVIHDFQLMHNERSILNVMKYWKVSKAFSFGYVIRHLAEFIHESKDNKFQGLQALLEYFGHKIAFYFGFFSFYNSWLVAPAVVGIAVFGMQFIPSEYDSMIDTSNEVEQEFDDQYDHPLMFAYAFFIILWAPIFLCKWGRKQDELSHLWHVDKKDKPDQTPNPYANTLPRLVFADGTWQYRSNPTKSQKKFRFYHLIGRTIPAFLLAFGAVFGYLYGLTYLDEFLDEEESLHTKFNTPFQKRNWYGTFAYMGLGGVHAIMIFVLNTLFRKAAIGLTWAENQATHVKFERSLAIKLVIFMFINTNFGLFYFAFWKKDIDKTAMHLASIVVVTQVLKCMGEFVLPKFSSSSSKKIKKSSSKVTPLEPAKELEDPVASNEAQRIAPGNMPETFGQSRMEVEAKFSSTACDFSDIVIQFGLIVFWGSAWPLAAFVIYLLNLVQVNIDVWKYCTYLKKPFSVRIGHIPHFWLYTLEGLAVLGLANQCFMLGISTNTMEEYFFPGISSWERLLAAFLAENFFALCYILLRLVILGKKPLWIQKKRREPLRYVRDAYRVGCELRERMQQKLLVSPAANLEDICRINDMDESTAEKYLIIVRYLQSRSREERTKLLSDPTLTISSLLMKVTFSTRSGMWADPGELTTSIALLQQIVPIRDLTRAYKMGRSLRETAYDIWIQNEDSMSPQEDYNVLIVRQFSCIKHDCTFEQAQRYCMLVRYIEQYLSGNPFEVIRNLEEKYPEGLLQALTGLVQEYGNEDRGEPVPGNLGTAIEPIPLARDAFQFGDVIRRKMFEIWITNNYLILEELMDKAATELGLVVPQVERYLMIKRYCESLTEDERHDVLNVKQIETLLLTKEILSKRSRGSWKDEGERSFKEYTPPVVTSSSFLSP